MVSEQPSSQELVEEKQAEMLDNWSQLIERADERKNNLLQSRELQRFLADLRDLVGVVTLALRMKTFMLGQLHVHVCLLESRTSNFNKPSYTLHQISRTNFSIKCFDCTLQLVWSKDFHERLTSDDLAKSVAEAERLLANHKERKVKSDWMINMYSYTCTYIHCSYSG